MPPFDAFLGIDLLGGIDRLSAVGFGYLGDGMTTWSKVAGAMVEYKV